MSRFGVLPNLSLSITKSKVNFQVAKRGDYEKWRYIWGNNSHERACGLEVLSMLSDKKVIHETGVTPRGTVLNCSFSTLMSVNVHREIPHKLVGGLRRIRKHWTSLFSLLKADRWQNLAEWSALHRGQLLPDNETTVLKQDEEQKRSELLLFPFGSRMETCISEM